MKPRFDSYAAEPLADDIRFRCEAELKPRLKRIAKATRRNSYQAVVREVIWQWVEAEEKRLGLAPLAKTKI